MKNRRSFRKTKKKAIIIVSSFLAFFVILTLGFYAVFQYYYQLMNIETISDRPEYVVETFIDEQGNISVAETIEPEEEDDPEADNSQEEHIQAVEDTIQVNLEQNQEAATISDDNVINILLIGIDSRRDNDSGRSDSMILFSINNKSKKITITSIMRDIYVSIPGVKNNRINTAYAYGRASLLLKTIKQNFNIAIDKYASVNFYSYMDIVDAVGSLDLEITADEIYVMNEHIIEMNQLKGLDVKTDIIPVSESGLYSLNGKQALAYARLRRVGNADFARTERQRKILLQTFEKIKTLGITDMTGLLDTLLPKVTTNLTSSDCLLLLTGAVKYLNYNVETLRIPIDNSYTGLRIDGMSVLGIDFEANINALKEKIYN